MLGGEGFTTVLTLTLRKAKDSLKYTTHRHAEFLRNFWINIQFVETEYSIT